MGDREKIQWHPAFQQAMWLELSEYHKELTFVSEYPLTTEPLRIDTLIIKKAPGARIEKNIGRVFRGHNIVEYKSPRESLTFDDYNKAFAYTYLYASLARVHPDDLSITFVTSRHPRELLRDLRGDPALRVEPAGGGIYYVAEERMPVQIVESKALSKEENLWLNSLRGNLEKETLRRLINECKPRGGDVAAYIHVVLEANEKTLKGDVVVGNLAKTLTKNPAFVQEIEKLGYRDLAEPAKRMLRRGDTAKEVAYALSLSLERVKKIKKEIEAEQNAAALS